MLSIRFLAKTDIPQVAQLLATCFKYPALLLPQIITELGDRSSLPFPTYFSLVIPTKDEISAVCEVMSLGNICYLTNLCVSPAFRGFGIGSWLVMMIEVISQALNIKYICLNVLIDNTIAQKFYNKLGYQNQCQMIARNNQTYLMGKIL